MVAYRGSVRQQCVSPSAVLEHHDERRRVMEEGKVIVSIDYYEDLVVKATMSEQVKRLAEVTDGDWIDKRIVMAICMTNEKGENKK